MPMSDKRVQQGAWDIPKMPAMGSSSMLNFEEQTPGSAGSFAWLKSEIDTRQSPGMYSLAGDRAEASDISLRHSSLKGGEEGSLSFKELHAERNKQAQRRFRKRQKEKIQELADKLVALKNEKADLEQRQAMLERACQMRDEELEKVRLQQKAATEQEDDELARSFQGAVTLTFREQETITLTPSQIKQLSEQELAKFWSMYVKELAVLLVSVEGSEEAAPDVMGRIKALVQTELLSLYIRAALTNMQSVKKFIARAKIEEVRVTANSIDAPNRWNKVSQSLQLSAEQGRNVTALWQKFVSSIGKIVEERKVIHANLQHCNHPGESGHGSALQYLKAHEQIEALKKSLRAEHVQIHEFLVTFFLKELTVMQMAKCFVKSFPFYPDIPAISAWVAVANKDPLAESKIAALECQSPAMSS